MKPTPRQLEAFITATARGGFTRAAEKMNITQSAVSVLIRQLEDGLNVRLFDRNSRSFRLTPAGREMLPTAERILSQLNILESSAFSAREKGRDRVTFAISAGLAPGLLPLILETLQVRHPNLTVVIQDVEPAQLIPKILNEEVEIGFGHVSYPGPELDVKILSRGQMCAVFRSDYLPRRHSSLSWAQVLKHKIIVPPKGMSLRMLLDETLAAHKMQIKARYEPTLFSTAVSLAARGLGIAIVPPYLFVRFQYPNLVSIPITGPSIVRELMAVTKSGRPASAAVNQLLNCTNEVLTGPDAGGPRKSTSRRSSTA